MGRLRYWGGRLRRFGLRRTLYNIRYNAWDRLLPYDAFNMTEEETAALVKAAEETGLALEYESGRTDGHADYIVHIPDGVVPVPALFAYCAVTAARHLALYGELPAIIYWDELYSDCTGTQPRQTDAAEGFYKPDFAPESLCGFNYIGAAVAVRAELYPDGGWDDSRPHTQLLRILGAIGDGAADDVSGADTGCRVAHVRRALTRVDMSCEAATAARSEDASRAIAQFLAARGVAAGVSRRLLPGWTSGYASAAASRTDAGDYPPDAMLFPVYDWVPELDEKPLVSIIIPNKDSAETLRACIDSILSHTAYSNYEILIIENNSTEAETYDYYDELEDIDIIRILPMRTDFNYSYINNYGAAFARGEYLLFLNNDTEVGDPDWLGRMLTFAKLPGIGAVGAKLLYPDGTIQHGGVTIGVRGVAGHAFIGSDGSSTGYGYRLVTVQDLSAVTAACMLVPARVFWETGGFDERYRVALNDSDLCLRIREEGWRILFVPSVVLTHFESKSRGRDEADPKKLRRFNRESNRFQYEWFYRLIEGDPYYNPNLSYEDDSFRAK